MSLVDWISEPVNWVFAVLALAVVFSAFRVVTSQNVVHAALFLVGTLAATAGLFILLSAEFVAWTLVLVYIGAVIVLFLFGIMITRAPMIRDIGLDNPRKTLAVAVSAVLFGVLSWGSLQAFSATEISGVGEATSTETLGLALLGRFVVPFEVVSFVLLAALIGGITIARKDLTPAEEERAESA
jgi:NADH-quinone oxidoreductase subunit J